jgi:molecular chaperone GrpE
MSQKHQSHIQDSEVEKSKQNLVIGKEQKEVVCEWKEKYIRILADYKNLEKRMMDERFSNQVYAAEILLRDILPIMHLFETAAFHLKNQGLDLAIKEFHSFLIKQGVHRIETIDKPFNPLTMECIQVIEGKDGVVMQELSPGYEFHDKVLFVAKVIVGKEKVQQ